MRIQIAIGALKSLRHFKDIQKLVLQYCEINHAGVVAAPLFANACNALQGVVEEYDLERSPPSPQLAAMVLENSSHPLHITQDTGAGDFHKLITGNNLRLELISLLLAMTGRTLIFGLSDNTQRCANHAFTDELLRSSTTCLTLCTLITPVNDVLVWAFYENVLFTCIMCGYTSKCHHQYVGTTRLN